ncbi:MAG: hypothetical protein ACRERD_10880 [Candidatus Binatia bacterium]
MKRALKRAFTWKATVASLTLATSMWVGVAGAEEQFQTLAGIQAGTMSHSELADVEGKLLGGLNLLGLLGTGNTGLLGGNNRGLLGLGLLGTGNTGLLGGNNRGLLGLGLLGTGNTGLLGGNRRGNRSLLNP